MGGADKCQARKSLKRGKISSRHGDGRSIISGLIWHRYLHLAAMKASSTVEREETRRIRIPTRQDYEHR